MRNFLRLIQKDKVPFCFLPIFLLIEQDSLKFFCSNERWKIALTFSSDTDTSEHLHATEEKDRVFLSCFKDKKTWNEGLTSKLHIQISEHAIELVANL